jgi:hypothetical protein
VVLVCVVLTELVFTYEFFILLWVGDDHDGTRAVNADDGSRVAHTLRPGSGQPSRGRDLRRSERDEKRRCKELRHYASVC